jgi:hypothetical protein
MFMYEFLEAQLKGGGPCIILPDGMTFAQFLQGISLNPPAIMNPAWSYGALDKYREEAVKRGYL